MIDWDEIASSASVRRLRERVDLLTRLVERLGDALNEHNDNHEAHRCLCNVILYSFTPEGQRSLEQDLEEATS